MARRRGWVRKLPSGLWAATVRTPAGRITESFRLQGAANDWADSQLDQIRAGDWIDPRAGKTTVGAVWERWGDSRALELASRRRNASHWRCHVAPRWSRVPVGTILRPDVDAWVEDMRRRGLGATTIEGAVGVLRSALDLAVAARFIRTNPARGVKVPRRSAHLDRVLEPEEDAALLSALDRFFPDQACARLLCELMLYCGLRWEEAAAIDREHVIMRGHLIQVGPVVERNGTIRPYPKTPAGERQVPVDDDIWPRVRDLAMATPRGGLLIHRPRSGRPLDYSRWHDRIWSVALAGRPAYAGSQGHPAREADPGAQLTDPRPTPHDLRHTYGTRLGEQGVPPHEIMALMGHESLASVQRYLHAGSGRFDRARAAIANARAAR